MRPAYFLLSAWLMIAGTATRAAESAPAAITAAEIAPAKTSIYIGSVSLIVQPMTRSEGMFASTYAARVFPYFFYNEQGRFQIRVSDSDLHRLAAGQTIEFSGDALRDDGVDRRVEGRAIPRGPGAGDVKVRVFLSHRLVLVFNTTYQIKGP